ncbi:MAG: hypothetical protein FWF00_02420 [Endomicrobia bacterium]|nr:hypothetical protein [Endomicrobiia bacterium]MCL2506531.1 hypothetical protein [Endomicrobiia bacterium]
MIEFIKSLQPQVIIGIILIIVNFPLGWIGLVWFIHLAKAKCKKRYYIIGAGIYLLSWVALFLGMWLCGEHYARELFAKYRILIIEGTVIAIIAIAFTARRLIKKASKINKKCLIDKKAEKI